MVSMLFPLIVLLLCVASIKSINIVRIDGEQEFVVYINGLPLMAGAAYNMPAYQQLFNVMTARGEVIPASIRYEKIGYNGRLRVLNQPRVFHMRIAIVRLAGGQRSGINGSSPGTASPVPPPQTLSTTTTASPSTSPPVTEAVTQATTTTTEATTSVSSASPVPDTSSAPATTEAATTTEAASTLSTSSESSDTSSELPETSFSEASEASSE